MDIFRTDLGKIVDLPLKPEWGPGVISKVENRFAMIHFRNSEGKAAKKYSLHGSPLVLATNQDAPDLKKKVRSLKPKRKAKTLPPAGQDEKVAK